MTGTVGTAGLQVGDESAVGDGRDGLVVGIIGAGKLGMAIGRLLADAGYDLLVADRADAPHLALVVGSVLPDAELVDVETIAARADVAILAVPFAAARDLDLESFAGIVVDATNPWEATDALTAGHADTTCSLAIEHPGARVVKTFNHAAYADLLADARPSGAPGRRAFGVAGVDDDARALVGRIVDAAGFEPVPLDAAASSLLEPGGPVFGRKLDRDDLLKAIRLARAA